MKEQSLNKLILKKIKEKEQKKTKVNTESTSAFSEINKEITKHVLFMCANKESTEQKMISEFDIRNTRIRNKSKGSKGSSPSSKKYSDEKPPLLKNNYPPKKLTLVTKQIDLKLSNKKTMSSQYGDDYAYLEKQNFRLIEANEKYYKQKLKLLSVLNAKTYRLKIAIENTQGLQMMEKSNLAREIINLEDLLKEYKNDDIKVSPVKLQEFEQYRMKNQFLEKFMDSLKSIIQHSETLFQSTQRYLMDNKYVSLEYLKKDIANITHKLNQNNKNQFIVQTLKSDLKTLIQNIPNVSASNQNKLLSSFMFETQLNQISNQLQFFKLESMKKANNRVYEIIQSSNLDKINKKLYDQIYNQLINDKWPLKNNPNPNLQNQRQKTTKENYQQLMTITLLMQANIIEQLISANIQQQSQGC